MHSYFETFDKYFLSAMLKPMIKAHLSGKLVPSGVNDVLIGSVYYSEKTRLKKLIKMIIIITTKKTFNTNCKKEM